MKRWEAMGMLAIAGQVYSKAISDALVDVWMEFMDDIAADEGARAMKQHVSESSFFPTVADIRKRVADERVAAPDIAQAWGEVMTGIRRNGRRKEPTWSHPAIEAAIEGVGWVALCDTLNEALPTVRAQFERYFKAALETVTRQQNSGRLLLGASEPHGAKRIGSKSVGELMGELRKTAGAAK